MLGLTYKKYYGTYEYKHLPYGLITGNTLLIAVEEAIKYSPLSISFSEMVEIEKYKINAYEELKKVINILVAEGYNELENIGFAPNMNNLPAIKPIDNITQVYNIILEDIGRIKNIEKMQNENAKNMRL